ncbi:MAG: class II fructose-1,6-bisphosphate aldolase [Bacilli bacterium]
MLINSKKILDEAKKNNNCIAHFNINNLEWAKYIIEQAEKMNKPVILGVSESASKYMGGFNTIVGMIKGLIIDLNIQIPICLHLDHGKTFDICKKAIDAGFTSVMIDASRYSLEENINITKQVVAYAKEYDVTVEAEIGGITENAKADKSMYAKVDDCIYFVQETNIDSLAPALGSVHGIYKGKPQIDFERIKELNKKLNIPLVLHGGTGLNDDIIKKAISSGINKININTELQIAFKNEVTKFIKKNKKVYDPRKIIGSSEIKIKSIVKEKIKLFSE